MRYAGLAVFVAPARPRSEPWRLVAGLALGFVGYMVLNQVYFGTLYSLAGPRSVALHDQIRNGSTPLGMYVFMGSFALMILSAVLVARLLHDRGLASLLGPLHLLWVDFRAVSILLVGLGVVIALLPPWDMGGDFVPNMSLDRWLVLLPLSLLAVLIQVSAEEIVFRGYIQQQLAARFASPLIWMVLPASIFALGHYLPQAAGENAAAIALWAGVFGVLMADLTARAGNLGPAIAVHFWNNVSAILVISLPDSLSGLALYLSPFGMDDAEALAAWLPVDFAMMFVCWLAARLAIRR